MSSTNLGSSWFVTWRAEEYNYINGQTGKTGKQIHCNWRMSSSLRSRFPCSDPTTGKYSHEKHRREISLTLSSQLEQPRGTLSKTGHLEAAIGECNRLAGLTETRIPGSDEVAVASHAVLYWWIAPRPWCCTLYTELTKAVFGVIASSLL